MSEKWHPIAGFDSYEITRSGKVRQVLIIGRKRRRFVVLEVDAKGFFRLYRFGIFTRYSVDDLWAMAGLKKEAV